MTALRVLLARIKGLLAGSRREADLDQEVEAHLDLLTEENLRLGMAPAEARLAARRAFGGVDQMKEVYRDQRGLPLFESMAQDIRHGVRLLLQHRGFTAAAVVSLALGIGANTAIFGLINLALLKDPPVEDPDAVALINGYRAPAPIPAGGGVPADSLSNSHQLSYPMFRDLASRQRVFSQMAASGSLTLARFEIDGFVHDPTAVAPAFVSSNYFSMFGVGTTLGRTIVESDSRVPREGAVAVISYTLWHRLFGGDPAVIGRKITLNGVPFAVIGVLARGFDGERLGSRRDLWIPILMQPVVMSSNMLERRTSTWFMAFGRFAPGVTDEQAMLELTTLYRQLLAEEVASGGSSLINRPHPNQHRIIVARGTNGINAGTRQRIQPTLTLLAGVAAIVLLIACCNVANLLIARGTSRQREIGVRLALGASRGRLIRQLLTESALLSLVAAIIAVVLAQWTGHVLLRVVALDGREWILDANVLLYVIGISAFTCLLFGVIPAVQVTGLRATPATLTTGFRQVGSSPRRRVARGLVALQVALSLWLLIGAGLLIRSLHNFNTLDIGVDRRQILLVSLQSVRPIEAVRAPTLQDNLRERLMTVPGVNAVSFARYGLFGGGAQTAPVSVPDSGIDPPRDGEVRLNYVSPEYFSTLGMAVIRGRDFSERDTPAGQQVIVINETMAKHYFRDRDPIGSTVYFPSVDQQGRYIPFERGLDQAQGMVIVGVVRDAKFDNLRDPVRRLAYRPLAQGRMMPATVLVRTAGEPGALAATVRSAVADLDPDLSVRTISALEDQIGNTINNERTIATLVALFGALALLLACVGLYGVTSYGIARRTSEIGVRIALGATRGKVVTMILLEVTMLAAIGVALGVPAALSTTHLVKSLLFGLTPNDPATIGGMIVVMLVVVALAGWIPARRAARIDPTAALRCE